MDGMKQRVVMQNLGLCPCGGKIYVSIDPPCVAHEPPTCEKFDDLEPDDFLTYVRKTRGIPAEPES